MIEAWRVARYRFRATFGRQWGGLFAIVVLIGLVGGLAIGAVRGARRTQSSFPAYLRHINADNLGVITAFDSSGVSNVPYNAKLVAKIARLPPREAGCRLHDRRSRNHAARRPRDSCGGGWFPAEHRRKLRRPVSRRWTA